MADDLSFFRHTDSYNPDQNYTHPEAAKAQRDYAKAMLYGAGQQPVHHWTQGVSNMVNALMGGRSLYDANNKQNQFGMQNMNDFRSIGAEGGAQANPQLGAETPPPRSDQPAAGSPPEETQTATTPPSNGLLPPTSPAQATPSSDNTASMVAALKGKSPNALPSPEAGNAPPINPQLAPRPMMVPSGALGRLMMSDQVNPQTKQWLLQQYANRNQPQRFEDPNGNVTVVDPRNPAVQQQFNKLIPWNIKGKEGVELPGRATYGPGPGGQQQLRQVPMSPNSGVQTPQAGSPTPPVGTEDELPDINLNSPKSSTPSMMNTAPPGMEEGGPKQAVPEPDAPPRAKAIASPTTPQGAPPTSPMAGTGSPLDPQTERTLNYLDERNQIYDAKKTRLGEDAKKLADSYIEANKSAIAGLKSQNMASIMEKMITDPRFHHGALTNFNVNFDNLLNSLDKNKLGPALEQAYEKMRAGGVLQDLQNFNKDGGPARILQAEMPLFNAASASLNNTLAAKLAIIRLNSRAGAYANSVANVVNGYRKGGRLDPKTGDWKKDRVDPDTGTEAELRETLVNWARKNPFMGADEQKQYMDIFNEPANRPKAAGKPGLVDAVKGIFGGGGGKAEPGPGQAPIP